MRDTIEWRATTGGSNGPHRQLMVRNDYVGHLYEDASDGVNVAQVLEDIEVRYNVHAEMLAALKQVDAEMRAGLGSSFGETREQVRRAIAAAELRA